LIDLLLSDILSLYFQPPIDLDNLRHHLPTDFQAHCLNVAESIEIQTEVDLSDDQEERMLEEKPYTNPFLLQLNQLAVLAASEEDAAAKRRQDASINPVRPIPVLPVGFPYSSTALDNASKNMILHPSSFNTKPFAINTGPGRASNLDTMNAKNLHSFGTNRQPQRSWNQEGQNKTQSQLYEEMLRQLQVAMDQHGNQQFIDKVGRVKLLLVLMYLPVVG